MSWLPSHTPPTQQEGRSQTPPGLFLQELVKNKFTLKYFDLYHARIVLDLPTHRLPRRLLGLFEGLASAAARTRYLEGRVGTFIGTNVQECKWLGVTVRTDGAYIHTFYTQKMITPSLTVPHIDVSLPPSTTTGGAVEMIKTKESLSAILREEGALASLVSSPHPVLRGVVSDVEARLQQLVGFEEAAWCVP